MTAMRRVSWRRRRAAERAIDRAAAARASEEWKREHERTRQPGQTGSPCQLCGTVFRLTVLQEEMLAYAMSGAIDSGDAPDEPVRPVCPGCRARAGSIGRDEPTR